ncbi:hypothetical protein N7492_004088 [Penicillium capsulatum]|uniref:G-protein coupled receptors family 2 profile 2 domain-containing protein n=1 Tax=Penicillium capsulatum TaxID=69766 RepID=A0A9W9LWU9_9EURO|nr:hypothetical protein N7492_004088 [Penicillium capsulatum]
MTLSHEQIASIGITGRVTSVLSILGSFTIIGAFASSRHFRSPIHRIIFFNAFYNLWDSVGTMISVDGPLAGDQSSLCQFQGFVLQMFPVADVLWTFAMALDTYLVVFHHFDAHSLQKLEKTYLGIITSVSFIPALVFLFIHSPERGSVYGSETIWCSISPKWVLIRIVLYYAPISRLRDEFKLSSEDHIQLTSRHSGNRPLGNPGGSVTTTVQANAQPKSPGVLQNHITSESSVEQAVEPRPTPSSHPPLNYKMTKQRNVSFKQYILMPSLFFLALLTTWLTPTINRVSAFIHPGREPYSLLLAVSALGSLRGFWNGVIFVTIGMKGWKRRALERKEYHTRRIDIT